MVEITCCVLGIVLRALDTLLHLSLQIALCIRCCHNVYFTEETEAQVT